MTHSVLFSLGRDFEYGCNREISWNMIKILLMQIGTEEKPGEERQQQQKRKKERHKTNKERKKSCRCRR